MYPAPSASVTACRSIYIIPLDVLTMYTPRLLAWGSIFALPNDTVLTGVCHLVDILPHYRIEDGIGMDYELDYVRDRIGFMYEDHSSDRIMDFNHPSVIEKQRIFEGLMIDAARYLKTVLGPNLIFCQFLMVNKDNTVIMEVEHVQ